MLEWISELQNFGDRGVASQKVMEGQSSPHEILKISHDCKKG